MDEIQEDTTEGQETSPEQYYSPGLNDFGYPKEEDKQNIYSWFKRVESAQGNIKTANLNIDEIGLSTLPVRSLLELHNYCKMMGKSGFASFFLNEAQIILGTSLSRDGFLNKLAVTQKREFESKQKTPSKPNKGWFKKKKSAPTY